jgi:hypothetical protein
VLEQRGAQRLDGARAVGEEAGRGGEQQRDAGELRRVPLDAQAAQRLPGPVQRCGSKEKRESASGR